MSRTEFRDFAGLSSVIRDDLKAAEWEEERKKEADAKREKVRARKDEAVVNGVVNLDPIDKQSAMLLAKSPWYCHAPQVGAEERKRKEAKKVSKKLETYDSGIDVRNDGDKFSIDDIAAKVAAQIQKGVPKEMTALARAAVDARGVLRESAMGIGKIMDEFDAVSAAAAKRMRDNRMTAVAESASIVKAFKDVRQFFLGPDYEKEIARLSEFVDLCERLAALKESGFLDTIADTMITLDVSK